MVSFDIDKFKANKNLHIWQNFDDIKAEDPNVIGQYLVVFFDTRGINMPYMKLFSFTGRWENLFDGTESEHLRHYKASKVLKVEQPFNRMGEPTREGEMLLNQELPYKIVEECYKKEFEKKPHITYFD